MDNEKQLQAIEKELILLKGELKQTLASVRDHLLNRGLPETGFSTITSKPGNGGGQPVKMKSFSPKSPTDESETVSDSAPSEEVQSEIEATFGEIDPFLVIPELPSEDTPSAYQPAGRELDKSVPGVNMLANLIGWISSARREIGDEQLSTLLEIYGISGHLSLEMKDIILNMAAITSEKSGENNSAESWSHAMLALHGILTGSNAALNPMKPRWNETNDEPAPATGGEGEF
jgi:hypothetical protein